MSLRPGPLLCLVALVLASFPAAHAGVDDPSGSSIFCVESTADAQCDGVAVSASGNATGPWWGASQVERRCAAYPNGTARCAREGYVYSGGDAVAVTDQNQHSCVLLRGGDFVCVGVYAGQFASGDADSYSGGDAVDVAAGYSNTCAALRVGSVRCWGDSAWGVSDGYAGHDATQVSVGRFVGCALRQEGNVSCWGATSADTQGYGGGDARRVAVGFTSNFGSAFVCVLLADGNVRCAGDNAEGETAGYAGGDAVSVSATQGYACALLRGGNVRCWGGSYPGNAGYSGGDAVAVTTGNLASGETCAVLRDGVEHCWPGSMAGADDTGRALVAVSGSGAAAASIWGMSATGDASGCRPYDSEPLRDLVPATEGGCGAVSLTGGTWGGLELP